MSYHKPFVNSVAHNSRIKPTLWRLPFVTQKPPKAFCVAWCSLLCEVYLHRSLSQWVRRTPNHMLAYRACEWCVPSPEWATDYQWPRIELFETSWLCTNNHTFHLGYSSCCVPWYPVSKTLRIYIITASYIVSSLCVVRLSKNCSLLGFKTKSYIEFKSWKTNTGNTDFQVLRLSVPNSVTYLSRTPIFQWWVSRCTSKNQHLKNMWLKEIRLRA